MSALPIASFPGARIVYGVSFHLGKWDLQPTGRVNCSRLPDDPLNQLWQEFYAFRDSLPPVTVRHFAACTTIGFIDPVFRWLDAAPERFALLGHRWQLRSISRLRVVCRAWTDSADDLLVRRFVRLNYGPILTRRSWLMRVGLPRGAVSRALINPFVRRACKDDDVELLCAIHTHLYIADSDDMRMELSKEPNAARRRLADLLHVTVRPKRIKYHSGRR